MKELKEKVFVLYLQKTKKKVEELGVFSEKEDAEEARLDESFEYGSDKLFIKEEFRKKSLREIELEGEILDAIIENGGEEEKKEEKKEEVTVVVVTPQPVPIPVPVVTATVVKSPEEEQLQKVVMVKKKPMSTATKIVCVGLGCIAVAVVASALSEK